MAQQTAVSSRQFSLNLNDWWKGLIMAVLGAIIGLIQGMIETGEFDLNKIWRAAAIAIVAYLVKNFFDKPKVVLLNPTEAQVNMVEEGEAKVTVTQK